MAIDCTNNYKQRIPVFFPVPKRSAPSVNGQSGLVKYLIVW